MSVPRHDELQEQMLVARAQSEDSSAFGQLVELYTNRLRYFLRRLVGHDAAEDVLQETWLMVHRELSQLRSPRSFRPWLYRIARSRAIRHLRRVQKLEPIPDEGAVADGKTTQDDWTVDDAAEIHRALQQLKPAHREILILRFMETMPYEEISEVLEIGVGTVRSRLHYAKIALRHIIEEHDHD